MTLSNRQVAKLFSLASQLMEFYDENPFKIRGYDNAAEAIRGLEDSVLAMDEKQLEDVSGIGKATAKKILQISETGTFDELDQLLNKTPKGIIEVLTVNGISSKRAKTMWDGLQLDSVDSIYNACLADKVKDLKGMGSKTQQTIKEAIEFYKENIGNHLFAEAELEALIIKKYIDENLPEANATISGEVRRLMPLVRNIEIVLVKVDSIYELIDEHPYISFDENENTYRTLELNIPVIFHYCKEEEFIRTLFKTTGNAKHLEMLKDWDGTIAKTEEEIYKNIGFNFIPAEMREGRDEFETIKTLDLQNLISVKHLKGCVHNHSTYSDGKKTLEQMAQHCMDAGLEYFGISDHSKSAGYANGLQVFRVLEQFKEVEKLNEKLKPFRILKGIEADILNTGELDYEDDILKQFDYVVGSIHSNLNMSESDAMKRLLTAIENPYLTMVGHLTGRLLLRRSGYPVNHKKIIDACAANNKIIEVNANPKRLDMDWQWLQYALEKGVMLSINPDAHHTNQIVYMYYGVNVARKAGVQPQHVFNTFSLSDVEKYLGLTPID